MEENTIHIQITRDGEVLEDGDVVCLIGAVVLKSDPGKVTQMVHTNGKKDQVFGACCAVIEACRYVINQFDDKVLRMLYLSSLLMKKDEEDDDED